MGSVRLSDLVHEMDVRDYTAREGSVPLVPPTPLRPISVKALMKRQTLASGSGVGLAAMAASLDAQRSSSAAATVLSYIPPAMEDNSGQLPGTQGTDDSPSGQPWAKRQLTLTAPHDVTLGSENDHEHWVRGQVIDADVAASWITESGNLFQQYVHLAGQILAAIAAGYEAVEAAVAKGISSALGEVGVHVDPSVIEAGVKLALSAVGLPPTIPNVAQIYNGGLDYLAGAIADTVVAQAGLPLPVDTVAAATKAGLNAAITQLTSCPQPGQPNCGVDPGNPWTWGVATPYVLAHPAVMWIRISAAASAVTAITVDTHGQYRTVELPLPKQRPPVMHVPGVLWPHLPGDKGVGVVYTDGNPAMTAWSQQFFTINEPVTYLNDTGGAGQPEYPTSHRLNVIVLAHQPHATPGGKTATLHLRLGLPEGTEIGLGGVWPPYDGPTPVNWAWYYGAIPEPKWAPGPAQG